MKTGVIEWNSEGFGPNNLANVIKYLLTIIQRDYYTSIIVSGNFVVTQLHGGRFKWQMLSGIEKTGS